jgi:endonuclease/exonuclease/phosphatase family metal-dependent hydrolase
MPTIKFLCWNVEWMNDLFTAGTTGPAAFRPDAEKPQHNTDTTVKTRREHLSGVLTDLVPDVVVVCEGPSRKEELKLFFDTDVPGTWQVDLQRSPAQSQNIGIAVRTDTGKFVAPILQVHDTVSDKRFDPFLVDTDSDDVLEQHKFERRPLFASVSPAGGAPFTVLGLHLKSKGIFDALEWSRWWDTADANRKKILAQATQIRLKFLEPFLSDPATANAPLIVCGDINDGPGLDASERRLFGSGIERLMGIIWRPQFCLGNALFDTLKQKDKEELDFSSVHTTSFKDPIFNGVYQKEWIDHILYSRNQAGTWVTGAQVHSKMPDGTAIYTKYKHASDHYPVSVDVTT